MPSWIGKPSKPRNAARSSRKRTTARIATGSAPSLAPWTAACPSRLSDWRRPPQNRPRSAEAGATRFVFERLGYAIATFVVFMVGVLYLDRRHLVRDGIIAVISSFVLYCIFTSVLRVQLPAGPLKFLGL